MEFSDIFLPFNAEMELRNARNQPVSDHTPTPSSSFEITRRSTDCTKVPYLHSRPHGMNKDAIRRSTPRSTIPLFLKTPMTHALMVPQWSSCTRGRPCHGSRRPCVRQRADERISRRHWRFVGDLLFFDQITKKGGNDTFSQASRLRDKRKRKQESYVYDSRIPRRT